MCVLVLLEILSEFILRRSFISQKFPHIGSKLTSQHTAGNDVGTSHNTFSFADKFPAFLNFL